MNALGTAVVWCVLQVTVVGTAAGGLYLLARWLRPAAAAPVLLAGLLSIVALSLGMCSPWPHWPLVEALRPGTAAPTPAGTSGEPNDGAGPEGDAESGLAVPAHEPSPRPAAADRLRWALAEALFETAATPAGSGWRWPAVAAATALAGVAGGMAWLALGLWAVRAQQGRSRPVADRPLAELLDVLCAELGCTRTIELRQSDELVTAAMVGWRRPVLLLPADWPEWTDQERRAVLAHEVAHARGHDCLAALAGQLALMLHVYHPLLYWLAGRLRLEQELAADAAAAALAGGPRPYLKTIAELALRQRDRPVSWPARTFLPTRSTFLRRIAMLRDNELDSPRPAPAARRLGVAAVVLVGLLAAGLRGPSAGPAAVAAERPKAASAAATKSAAADKGLVRLSHTAQASTDKRSLGGSGHAVAFRRPAEARYLAAVQIYAGRYGMPQPPQEDFHVYVLDREYKTLHDFPFPYALIARGPETWYTLAVPATEVPAEFVVALAFNPHQTKGIYLGLDRNVQRSHSLVGLPGQGFSPVPEKYDWMVAVQLTAEAPKAGARKAPGGNRRGGAPAEKPKSAASPAEAVKEAVEQVATMAETDPRLPAVLGSLAELNQARVVAEVTKYLSSEKDNTRRAAVYVLWHGKFASIDAAVPALLRLCEHEEDLTRGMAAIALGANRVPKGFAPLMKMVDRDASGYARRCAAYALGLLGNKEAIEALTKALKDPETLVRQNAQAALRMFQPPSYTQTSHNDLQPDGTIRFTNPITIRNDTGRDMEVFRFVNSDFVQLESMADAAGKAVPFEARHEGDLFRYRVPLVPPLPPGQQRVLTSSGTVTTLIQPGEEAGTFVYRMKHWPAVSGATRRIEVHRLPPGAELLSKSPADLVSTVQEGRTELRIERVIPEGGNLEITYRYRLPK